MSHRIGLNIPVPQMLPVTGAFLLPFSLYNSWLSARVVAQRLKHEKYIGDTTATSSSPESDPLYVSSRAQANFLESVPLALILAGVAELNGANRKYLTWALSSLFAFRILHAEVGIMGKDGMGLGRPAGYYGTQAFLLGVAGWSAWLVKEYWGF